MIHIWGIEKRILLLLKNIADYKSHDCKKADIFCKAYVKYRKKAVKDANDKFKGNKDNHFDNSIKRVDEP